MIYVSTAAFVGGWEEEPNVNSPDIQKYAKIATRNISNSMYSPFHMNMMKVSKAEKQIVSGVNYKLEVHIGPSECRRDGNYTVQEIEDCPLQKCDGKLQCPNIEKGETL
ncbi:cystatin-1 [Nephila pilipes]|uniref:Cystatin-1 n=1 Tax=Nephila pilipes TaxID=299642 RepID=A0A8X6R484_NEPPI|nr:cystatin-1 [Nephila pilipes]